MLQATGSLGGGPIAGIAEQAENNLPGVRIVSLQVPSWDRPPVATGFVSATEPQGRQGAAPIGDLYERLAPELRAFLLGLLRDHDLADEALHASFTKVIEKQETIRDSNPRAWLFQVAYHEAMAARRRRGVERRGLQGLAWLRREVDAAPEAPLIRAEVARRIHDSLNTLPPDQRDVVVRRIQQNQTFAAMAAELGVPLGTVLTRMRLALQKLRQQLADLQ